MGQIKKLDKLPPKNKKVETVAILRQLAKSANAIGELKGVAKTIPNQAMLINTVVLQEAKDSSEIENYLSKISLKIIILTYQMLIDITHSKKENQIVGSVLEIIFTMHKVVPFDNRQVIGMRHVLFLECGIISRMFSATANAIIVKTLPTISHIVRPMFLSAGKTSS